MAAVDEFEEIINRRGAAGAQTILDVYGPVIDEGILIAQRDVINAPPVLEALLDARAKLRVFLTLRAKLASLAAGDLSPAEAMKAIVNYNL